MSFKERVGKVLSARSILWNMTKKELKTKYLGSVLGIWWAVITPLLMMAALTFIFTKVLNIGIERFPLFSLAGIIPWFFLSVSLSEVTPSLIVRSQLLKQFSFPTEFIPIASVLANFINFLIGLCFIIPIFVFFETKVIFVLAVLPLVLFLHLIFTLGLGLVLSCLNIFFRDISHFLGILLIFWFWMTPIFYSLDMVPIDYRWICKLNPMATYISLYRDILFKAQMPSKETFLIAFIFSLSIFCIGYFIFRKKENYFIKRI